MSVCITCGQNTQLVTVTRSDCGAQMVPSALSMAPHARASPRLLAVRMLQVQRQNFVPFLLTGSSTKFLSGPCSSAL